MDSHLPLKLGADRYRGITEKSRALLFLLREAPYIILPDAQRYFYPSHKTLSYTREMTRVLVQNGLVAKHQMGDGHFIYYLTEPGWRISEFYLEDKPKFDAGTESFYYKQKPTRPSEVADFFIFPTQGLEFYPFTPHYLNAHPMGHTRSLLELSALFRQSYRFRHVLWMDMIKAKKSALHVSCQPDLLLCNSLTEETGRVYIEFENSRIRDLGLLEKIHHLTEHRADWYVFLAATEEIFHNLGRLVRKILSGEVKVNHQTVFFNPRDQAALNRNLLFGLWTPSFRKEGPSPPFKSLELFRYDHEVFDKQIWIPEPVKPGSAASEPRAAHWQKVGYAGRHIGKRKWLLSEIIDPYATVFQHALEDTMA